MNLRSGFYRAAQGYLGLVRSIGAVAAALASALVVSMLIVFPLWWLATERRALYNMLVLGIVAAALLALGVGGVIRRRSQHLRGEIQPSDKKRHLIPRALVVIVLLVAAYAIAVLYGSGAWIAAVPATLVFLGLLGYLLRTPAAGVHETGRDDGSPGSDRQDA